MMKTSMQSKTCLLSLLREWVFPELQETRFLLLALPLNSCVTLDQALDLSGLLFSQVSNGITERLEPLSWRRGLLLADNPSWLSWTSSIPAGFPVLHSSFFLCGNEDPGILLGVTFKYLRKHKSGPTLPEWLITHSGKWWGGEWLRFLFVC